MILIAGNHDKIRGNSALLSFTWSPNVTWLMDETLTSVYFEDINTEVYGFSYHTTEIKEARLEDIQVPLNSRIQILMAHARRRPPSHQLQQPGAVSLLLPSPWAYP
mgnify:CR=1 FL=1